MASSYKLILLALLLAPVAWGKALTDGTTASIEATARPGELEAVGQQNLRPWVALNAGFAREIYGDFVYSGWTLGSSWRLAQLLGDRWRALAIASLGLTGLQGADHGHLAFYTGASLEWESRHALVGMRASWQRGTAMPDIDEGEARLGYSPLAPSMDSPQPWLVLAYLGRSGSGEARLCGLLRLLAADWSLELGTSFTGFRPLFALSVAL